MEPRSKVSVPLTVVMRTRSRVPLIVTLPAQYEALLPGISTETPLDTHTLLDNKVNTIEPDFIDVPAQEPVVIKPLVLD